jgi:hypothetical protein
MKACVYLYENQQFIAAENSDDIPDREVQLVIGFGSKELLAGAETFSAIRAKFAHAQIALCSTAGEIFGEEVKDGCISIVAIRFAHTDIHTRSVSISDFNNSYDAGASLMNSFDKKGLSYVFVLSDGGRVNGSELVRGIESSLPDTIPVTGGLAGDGNRFESTLVGLNEQPVSGRILAIGFYGDAIRVGHGSMGGWEVFGLEKSVTRSTANELFEIDEKNALTMYKQYLGKYADELPGSALLFPLSVQLAGNKDAVVRTILSIDDKKQSMIFAGDVPEGSRIRFMKANFDRLIDAATLAAQQTFAGIPSSPKVALLISCVGRKLILDKRVDEEVEAVAEALGTNTLISGFYSYGEISPLNPRAKCELHNQTMTITTIDEA